MQPYFDPHNLDSILDEVFGFAELLAKEFYFDHWAKNPPQSSAFNGEVIEITRAGWEHIIDDPRKSRMDKLGRILTFERAKALLEIASTFQDHQRSTNGKIQFWGFSGVVELVKVRVIVRSVDDGPKHFYSVIRKGTVEE